MTSSMKAAYSDRTSLTTFHRATTGTRWTNSRNWLGESLIGCWHGVLTLEAGRVFSLDVSNNNLSGALPGLLGELTSLGYLRLLRNRLTGPIPPQLGNLTGLGWLRLLGNDLGAC